MYSHTKRATRFQTFVAAVLIAASVFFFTPPKQADAVVLFIVAALSTTALAVGAVITLIIIDGIILCAVGVICGSSSTDSSGCSIDQGNTCRSEENTCGDYNTGTIQCDGTCSVGPPSDFTGNSCPENYCGMTGSGQERCDGTCTSSVAPDNSLCTGLPLPDDALTLDPEIVRIGDTVTLSWDLGMNWPPECTLTGKGVSPTFTGAGDATGSISDIVVEGPHRYVLTCGDSEATVDVKVLPEIFDS